MIWFLVLFLLMAAACCFIYFNDAFAVTDDASSYPQAICELHEMMHGNFDDSFGSGRIHIYRNVLRLVPEHLFFGGGPDTLVLRETEDFRRYDAGRNMWIETHIDSAHSEYLNILVNQGIFALAAFLGIMVCAVSFLLRQGFGISRRSHPLLSCGGQLQGCGAFLRTACGASVVSWLIQALFGISTYISAPYFWIMLGMLFCRAESDG